MKRILFLILVLLVLGNTIVFPCSTIIVGKKASIDGTVLFGHNEDDGGRRVVNVWRVPRITYKPGEVVILKGGAEIPQVEQTWSLLWFQVNDLPFSDYYLNEWGVAVASDACASREDQKELTDGGIGFMLRRIVAERAKSAREGVEIAGKLLDTYGYNSSGRTLIICDSQEGWILSIVGGKHWVAQRVPDDGVVFVPNTYIIREVDFDDQRNFIVSSNDVRDYAIKRGWYNPQSGDSFDFAYSYMRVPSPNGNFVKRGYDTRQWRAQQLISGKTISIEEAKKSGLPFTVKPKKRMAVSDIMDILRDHNEGTIYAPVTEKVLSGITNQITGALPNNFVVNPNGTRERTICTITTIHSTVVQYRNNLFENIGCVLWTCFGRPDFNVYVPWYGCITDIPKEYSNTPGIDDPGKALKHHFNPVPGTFEYDPGAAFWIINDLENLADAHYSEASEIIKPVLLEFEKYQFQIQKQIEKIALNLYKKNQKLAVEYLTEYTKSRTGKSLRITKRLTDTLKTKFYH